MRQYKHGMILNNVLSWNISEHDESLKKQGSAHP